MIVFRGVWHVTLAVLVLSASLISVDLAAGAGIAHSAPFQAERKPTPSPTVTPVRTGPGAKYPGPFAVVIVVDAARYDEINLSQMPNLAKLAALGTQYSQAWVGQLPSVTESSHATIGTGVLPDRHGVLGDTWRVPGTESMAPDLLNSQLTRTGYIGKFIKQTGVPSLPSIIRTSWPNSPIVALSGHKIYAADALGAGSADYVAFGVKNAAGHFVPSAIPGREYAPSIENSPQLNLSSYPRAPGAEDDWTTTLAEKFLFKYHPRLMMINLPEVDIYGHIAGTSASVMQPLMTNVDHQIGRLVDAYGRAGILSRTTFLITADHGMVPGVHTVSSEEIKKIVVSAGGDPLYVGHGDYSALWIKNPGAIDRVKAALVNAKLPNVSAVYARNPQGRYILASPVSWLADPSVVAAQTDLLSTLDVAESPDIVLMYDENTITMTPNFIKIGRKGDHGGATWGAQHIPFIISGPRIKKGVISNYPARLVDIAPTIESLLETYPAHQDGTPLADAIVNPPKGSVELQSANAPRLESEVQAMQREAALRPHILLAKPGAK